MATVPFSTVRKQFSAIVRRVESGEEIIITRRGKPAARLIAPPQRALEPRSYDLEININRANQSEK